jgi:hypothetical protein
MKRFMMLAAIGRGVILALALTGAVRISCWLLGVTLPENVVGNLFLLTSAVAGSLSAYFYARSLKHSQPAAASSLPGSRD